MFTFVLAILIVFVATGSCSLVEAALSAVRQPYNQPVARIAARPIQWAIYALYPVVRVVELMTRRLKPNEPAKKAAEEDVSQLAKISVEEGSILGIEGQLIQNSLRVNEVTAKQIMTPARRAVTLKADSTVEDAFAAFREHSFSRIPVCDPKDPERWVGLVYSRDILFAMANDQFKKRIREICRPLHFVTENQAGHILLDACLKKRIHQFAVGKGPETDNLAIGLVTLEDVIEEILGTEIVDEKEQIE